MTYLKIAVLISATCVIVYMIRQSSSISQTSMRYRIWWMIIYMVAAVAASIALSSLAFGE